jgi:hypothetical protein
LTGIENDLNEQVDSSLPSVLLHGLLMFQRINDFENRASVFTRILVLTELAIPIAIGRNREGVGTILMMI